MKVRAIALVAVLALAGCGGQQPVGPDANEIIMTGVNASDSTDGYDVSVTFDAEQRSNGSYSPINVTGLGSDGSVVCGTQVDSLGSGGTVVEQFTCDRLPLTVQAELADAESAGDGPTVLYDEAVALVDINGSTTVYETPPRETDIPPHEFSQCELRRANASGEQFDETTPWLSVERLEPTYEADHQVIVERVEDGPVTATANGPGLDPVPLPESNATAVIRDAIEEERDGGDVIGAPDAETNRTEQVAMHEALLDRNVSTLAEVGRVSTRGGPAHAAGAFTESDGPEISCVESVNGTYTGGSLVTTTYAVTIDGELWEIKLSSDRRWSGQVFADRGGS